MTFGMFMFTLIEEDEDEEEFPMLILFNFLPLYHSLISLAFTLKPLIYEPKKKENFPSLLFFFWMLRIDPNKRINFQLDNWWY